MPSPAGRVTRALQHRNFRLFFGGQSVFLVGTWITRVATSWLVYRLTGSALLLGVAGFAGQIPTLIITPLGGLLVAGFGEAWCFAIDAISYIAVIASIVAMRVPPRARHEVAEMHLLDELHHGWKYVLHSVPIRSALVLVAIVSMAGTPYTVLMPGIASQGFLGGPKTLGPLVNADGVGALGGAR